MAKTNCRKRSVRLRMRMGKGMELLEETVEVGFLLKREKAIVGVGYGYVDGLW